MRQALRKTAPFGNVRTAVLSAPIRGWRSDEGAAKEQPGSAIKLLNFIPQPDVVRLRRGYDSHATGMTDEVETLMVYTSATATKMFAAVGGFIYDASIAGAAAVSLSGMSEARYSWTNMSTTGGQFLTIANGVDTVRVWNGGAWSEPAITGIVSTTALNYVWQYKNREWFLKKQSMSAFYLPIDSIAGALLEFNIGSLFNRGGYLVAGATWSVDSGDGMDDLICFMTSEGELAIYSMVDPSDAANVFLKGVYYLGRPVGDRCLFKLGADLVAITNAGLVPISKVLTTGTEKLEEAALTAPIRHDYSDNAEIFGLLDGWQIVTHPRSNLLVLNIPVIERVESKQFVMNILTGAWCEWNNVNALCWTLYGEDIYFGAHNGIVYKAETGSQDAGASITGEMVLAFSQFGASARQKHIKMVRPNVYTNINSRGTVYVLPDYFNSQHVDISGDIGASGLALWDDAIWDGVVWPGVNVIRQWRVGGNIGTALAIKFVITAATHTPEADLDYRVISFDVAHEVGGVLWVRFVIDDPQRCADWMFDRHGWLFHQPYTAIGQETDDGRLTFVSVFNNYNGIDIEWTAAGRWTRGMWRVTLEYIFETNGCRRCTMRTKASNTQVIKSLIHLGARLEGRLRWYYGDEDALVFGLLKEEATHV